MPIVVIFAIIFHFNHKITSFCRHLSLYSSCLHYFIILHLKCHYHKMFCGLEGSDASDIYIYISVTANTLSPSTLYIIFTVFLPLRFLLSSTVINILFSLIICPTQLSLPFSRIPRYVLPPFLFPIPLSY